MISIIIPIYNEAQILKESGKYFKELDQSSELIFVDGGSDDESIMYAAEYGKVIFSEKSRSFQMNKGAKEATQNILLFLHVDTKIEIPLLKKIEQIIHEDGFIGGCFSQVIDQPGLLYKWIAFTGNIRAKLSKIFYGDQGIFVRRDIFEDLGGFPPVQFGEDVYFSKKLRKAGQVDIFGDPIFCSPRRWKRQGLFKTYWTNLRVNLGLMFNQDPTQLAKQYRDVR